MRWKKEKESKSTFKIIHIFLVFPRCINDEYRWWEWAYIFQKWDDGDFEIGDYGGWKDVRWCTSGDEELYKYLEDNPR